MKKTNTLIIFTNKIGLGSLKLSDGCNLKFKIDKNDDYLHISDIAEIDVWLVKDESLYANINSDNFLTIPNVNYNSKTTYIVLHKTKQGENLKNWRSKYSNANIDEHSHSNKEDNFYKKILIKICKGELKVDDLEIFFQTKLEKALNELCDTWSDIDFTDKPAMKELADKASKQLKELV